MPHATTHRILFIDAYDSFTNNIIALLETHLHVSVTTIKIDEAIPDFTDFVRSFSAVIAGPGPGDPRNAKDVGWIRELWKLEGPDLLPILGICLGFQSLVLASGGSIDKLAQPRHGLVRRVRGTDKGIFDKVKEVETVQYHSLHATLGLEDEYRRPGSHNAGKTMLKCSDLRPLAWDYEMDNTNCIEEAMSPNPQRILMAVEHRSKPFSGIQFHAESICSNVNARKIIEAWWENAKRWRRPCQGAECLPPQSNYANLGTFQADSWSESQVPEHGRAVDHSKISSTAFHGVQNGAKQKINPQQYLKLRNGVYGSQCHGRQIKVRVTASVMDVGEASVPSICETLSLNNGEAVILDSDLHQRRDIGEYSIIGVILPNSLRLEYQTGTNEVRQILNGQSQAIDLRQYRGNIFSYLKSFMSQYKVEDAGNEVPFWGGLMGFISYEACLETLGITDSQVCPRMKPHRPDLSFVFVDRSIVIDHSHQKVHVQSIKPNDRDWIGETALALKRMIGITASLTETKYPFLNARVSHTDRVSYESKVGACQSAIRAGDSYELCLTTQATIRTRNVSKAWPLYLRLRQINPAPFSAYIRLGKLTLLSSSPERFLQWSRPSTPSNSNINDIFNDGEKTIRVQFRPIKGTVQRQPDPNLPPLTLAEATALLATPKERAENLMIVDLIRHDLHGVVGSGRVTVPKLMVVEEYATLFQLVSVVEGSLLVEAVDDTSNGTDDPPTQNTDPPYPAPSKKKTGLDILAASLPPGSMTGAPKLRSCQLLRSFEASPRGIYSGVLGYLDVGGGGDFSVIIRSAVRWDRDTDSTSDANSEADTVDMERTDETDNKTVEGDEWTIGAGGAVTSLSTEEGEWEEMRAKMESTLRLFMRPGE